MAGLKVKKQTIEAAEPVASVDENRIEYAEDSKGRRIGVRQLDALALFDITIALGEVANNASALNQALMVSSVVEIDGEPVIRPASLLQVRALVKRIGLHGYEAVREALSKFTEVSDEAGATAAKN